MRTSKYNRLVAGEHKVRRHQINEPLYQVMWWLYKNRVLVSITSGGGLKRYSDWPTGRVTEISRNGYNEVTEVNEPRHD